MLSTLTISGCGHLFVRTIYAKPDQSIVDKCPRAETLATLEPGDTTETMVYIAKGYRAAVKKCNNAMDALMNIGDTKK